METDQSLTQPENHELGIQAPVRLSHQENRLADEVFGDVLDTLTGEDEADLHNPTALMTRAVTAIERRGADLDRDKKNLIAKTAVTDILVALNKAAKEAARLTADNSPVTTA